MRLPISISIVLMLAGVSLVIYATTLPVYTDVTAPERLSSELEAKPRETRFKQWYSQLRSYETPHKKLSDFGRGLCAAGVGLLLATGVWVLYHRFPWMRNIWAMFLLWLTLWTARIPLSMWYYRVRQQRFDYPVWGDSIAIPVFSESLTWIVGALVSSLVRGLLIIRRPIRARIRIIRPSSAYGWIRAAFLACWIVVLGLCIASGIPDGDEGMVLASIIASVVLLAFLSAQQVASNQKLHDTSIAHSIGT